MEDSFIKVVKLRVTMKKRILMVWAVFLVAVLLVSSFLPATPVAAGISSWSAEPIPGTEGNVLGPAGIDVRDLAAAADGATVYAAPGDSTSPKVIYKSTDTGTSWQALSVPIQADLIAVAPDDAAIVAVTSNNTPVVYATTDGGTTWDSLGTPQENDNAAAAAIYDIAISPASDGVHYIAAAGKEVGGIGRTNGHGK